MLTLKAVALWLMEVDSQLRGKVTVGCIDAKKDQCLGVYNDKKQVGNQKICIGGDQATKSAEKLITILVHWGRNPSVAEEVAISVYQKLFGTTDIIMQGIRVAYVDPGEGPIPVGVDEKGIYEYVINAKICYERT